MITVFSTDYHTHTIASGHGSFDTITDLARAAGKKGLRILGITDHAPSFPGSAKESYFRSLLSAPKTKLGVEMRYGVELDVLDPEGHVALSDELLSKLDYSIISLHGKVISSMGCEDNTRGMIAAMDDPGVLIIGHPDDDEFPLDLEKLLFYAQKKRVYPEINNASLMPGAYRRGCKKNCTEILRICKKLSLPVFLSSDSHGAKHVGDFSYAIELLSETGFPEELIINRAGGLYPPGI